VPHNFDTIEERWKKGWEYHYIPTGQSYRELLLERCGKELLDALDAYMWVKDAPLQSGQVMITLRAFGMGFDLHNIGYTEYPKWQLAGHTRSGKWLVLKLKDEELRSHLEELLHLLETKEQVYAWIS
jgi:hypothetical protein